MTWTTKLENNKYKCTPATDEKERTFYLDKQTLEPIGYWYCSDQELKDIVASLKSKPVVNQPVQSGSPVTTIEEK